METKVQRYRNFSSFDSKASVDKESGYITVFVDRKKRDRAVTQVLVNAGGRFMEVDEIVEEFNRRHRGGNLNKHHVQHSLRMLRKDTTGIILKRGNSYAASKTAIAVLGTVDYKRLNG